MYVVNPSSSESMYVLTIGETFYNLVDLISTMIVKTTKGKWCIKYDNDNNSKLCKKNTNKLHHSTRVERKCKIRLLKLPLLLPAPRHNKENRKYQIKKLSTRQIFRFLKKLLSLNLNLYISLKKKSHNFARKFQNLIKSQTMIKDS